MLALALLLAVTPAIAKPPPTHDAASALVKAGDLDGAVKAYKALIKSSPDDAKAWYMLGYVELQRARYDKAIAAYRTAKEKGFYPQVVDYDLACAHARSGDEPAAEAALRDAVAAGYKDVEHARQDADLAPLRDNDAWDELISAIDRNARPCRYDDRHRGFDFWLGRWEVFDAAGTRVGSSTVSEVEEACAVEERWAGGLGDTGRSLNYLDPADGRWHQDWASSTGGVVHYVGGLTDAGAMDLSGTRATAAGAVSPTRCVWTPAPDGTVHQTFYKPGDDGTWAQTGDLTYRRVAPEGP